MVRVYSGRELAEMARRRTERRALRRAGEPLATAGPYWKRRIHRAWSAGFIAGSAWTLAWAVIAWWALG